MCSDLDPDPYLNGQGHSRSNNLYFLFSHSWPVVVVRFNVPVRLREKQNVLKKQRQGIYINRNHYVYLSICPYVLLAQLLNGQSTIRTILIAVYKNSSTKLPSHLVISQTTFNLKPTLVTVWIISRYIQIQWTCNLIAKPYT